MLPLGHMGITLFFVRTAAYIARLQPIDYKIIVIGSLLPDFIDKPLGIFFFPSHPFIKSFGHSLLFLGFLYGTSKLIRNSRHKNILQTLWICSVLHDIFDLMWHFPQALLWPINLPELPQAPYEPWGQILHVYGFSIRQIFALEIIGGGILIIFFVLKKHLPHTHLPDKLR